MENRKGLPARVCKKHPYHQQSPGVCSLCLREKLSNISGSSSQAISNVSSASSSSSISSISLAASSRGSSNAPSYMASPMHKQSNTYDVQDKSYFSFLRKSRSMAYVSEKIVENEGKKKKGDSFWSKLMGFKRNGMKKRSKEERSPRLMHSRTMREMLSTRV